MRIVNKSAYYNYHILDKFEAGISLTGGEVKSVKKGAVSLKGAYARIIDSQAYLINAHINPYEFARVEGYEPTRSRKLLLRKKEIISLGTKLAAKNLTLAPLALYTKQGIIKVELGLARGKKKADKRKTIKKKDWQREREKEFKIRSR